MTQPLCAYEGCVWHQLAAAHYYRKDLPVSIDNHPFQPQSTVESAPVSTFGGAGLGELPEAVNYGMGFTPAASTEERLSEIAEPDLKELIEDFGRACVRFGGTEDGSVEESEAAAKSNKLHADLLRLVAELRGDLKTVNEAWHADLVQWGQEQKAATARAEQAERERDELKLKLEGK